MSNPNEAATQKDVTIYVNGRPKIEPRGKLSFWDIVQLAFPGVTANEKTIYTVTYKKGHGNKEGGLVAGDTIEIKDGMVFNVTPTDKS